MPESLFEGVDDQGIRLVMCTLCGAYVGDGLLHERFHATPRTLVEEVFRVLQHATEEQWQDRHQVAEWAVRAVEQRT